MKYKPILFKSEMVRAILDGTKTETRRVMKHKIPVLPSILPGNRSTWYFRNFNGDCAVFANDHGFVKDVKNPYAGVDRLWVRETWQVRQLTGPTGDLEYPNVLYRADNTTRLVVTDKVWKYVTEGELKWQPSIFMPRWACRLELKVISVKAERVQDITQAGALAEGVEHTKFSLRAPDPVVCFGHLWDSINKSRGYGWAENPWVWVIKFEVV